MEDLIKNFLYTSVGAVAFAAEKLRESLDKLVAEGKLSTEEGKKIVDEFLANTSSKKEEFESQIKALSDKALSSFKSSGNSEVEDLKARIEALEAKQKVAKAVSHKEASV